MDKCQFGCHVEIFDHLPESSSESVVHPDVNQRIGYRVAHGQVVSYEPNVHDAGVFPNVRVHIADNNERIEWEPGEGECDDTKDHHLDHL